MIWLSLIWLFKSSKYILFWVYLWQLKNYHSGRFIDHFRTAKGKTLVVNYILPLQLLLIIFFIVLPKLVGVLSILLLLIYLVQAGIFIKQIYRKEIKKPVFTKKASLINAILSLLLVLFFFWSLDKNPAWLVAFDIVLPLVVSIVVLCVQPFSVMARNRLIKKATFQRQRFAKLKVVAITGSYGKTSTKEFLTTILKKKFNVLETKDHLNSEFAVAKTILEDLNGKHEIFVAEVGAYNKGKVKEVCGMLQPELGIVTGVNEQHMALFGSMDNLLSAEGGRELESSLKEDGKLIVNAENKYCLDLAKRSSHQVLLYGKAHSEFDADIWTEQLEITKGSISFVARNKKGEMAHISAAVLGGHNIQNLLGAILAASQLGMSLSQIAEACKRIRPEQAGMTARRNEKGITVIDSSYSSNPDGVAADIEYVKLYGGKKVIVMPCLIELGKKAKDVHYEIGKTIGSTCSMAIVTSKDYFEQLKKGAMESGMEEKHIVLCDNSQDIYSLVTLFCSSGDAVLLEGRVPSAVVDLLS
jgi:UDP-N-acetylmuramoyl-tripeptide--D-alanyl-D-alanine ligase